MNRRFFYPLLIVIVLGWSAVSCAAPPALPAPAATVAPVEPTAVPAQPTATEVPPTQPLATTTEVPPTQPPPTATLLPTPTLDHDFSTVQGTAESPSATSAPSPTQAPATALPTNTSSAATAAPTSASGSSGGLNLDAIIPPGRGRELLFNNCTSCHSVVCSLIGERSAGNWNTIRAGHEERVSGLSEQDKDELFAYLIENFGDTKPAPELPPELKEQGCSAQ